MKKLLVFLLAVTLVFGSTNFCSAKGFAETQDFSRNLTPPNEAGIAKMLIQKGVIDKNASQEEMEKAVTKYLRERLTPAKTRDVDKMALLKKIKNYNEENIQYGNMLNGRKFGKKITDIEGVKEKPWTGEVRKAKLLVLLAEFGDDEYDSGPVHNQIAKPLPEDNTSFWVEDFSQEHYEKMLFTEGGYDAIDQSGSTLHLDSMVDYYLEQSGGSFKVDGDAYGWFKLPHSEAYYGDDDPDRPGMDGVDGLYPGTPRDLVKDLLVVAREAGVPFEDYDMEDPFDLDGDGNFDEPDGIIDHLVIVHAGVDQSGGGGAQGDNAIWAHSSSVFELIPSDNPTVPYWGDNMLAYNYIIQGEDGTIGVFCHEFGHDIGLPDEYDTIYSGNGDPVGFYSLMSSGSWSGKPLGTKPTPISPWGRWILGQIWGGQWVQPTEVDFNEISDDGLFFKLDQTTSVGSNNQVVKVNLPNKLKILTEPYEGSYEWYGGKGDEIDHTVATRVYLPDAASISLDFWTWYNIEEGWDFGFVQVSTDGGVTWKSLSSERTTDAIVPDGYPAIKENMPGYTGSSGGWVHEIMDLSEYKGQNIMLQFRYMTDWATSLEGFFVDDIKVIADGNVIFHDNAENGEGQWEVNGWYITEGFEEKAHYYLLEWRNLTKTDEGLLYGYNWVDYDKGIAEYFRHEPGLIVWYRDTSYDDNWVGVHPGHGFLGIVDSHPQPMVAQGVDIRTRIQIHDAAFSLDRVQDKVFTFFGKTHTFQGKQAQPEFNDSHKYWNPKAPSSGIIVPDYGIKFKVIGRSPDFTVGEIAIYK
ncbi:MAG: immune inhibitor [Thermoanaerobacteraceae bacterium]|nr:immune inhibitor [Thermoanaerobacteraceae bacterium]